MKMRGLFTALFLLICVADLHAATSRDQLISKELNCIADRKNAGLTWNDVCSMQEPSSTDIANKSSYQIQDLPSSDAFNSRAHTFSMANDTYYYYYSEPNKTKRYTGVWYGVAGKYIFRPPQGNILNNPIVNFYSLEATYAAGKSKKEGEVSRDSDGTSSKVMQKNIPGYMYELRALLGRDFTFLSDIRLTPYLGGALRYLADQGSGHYDQLDDGTPIIGYDRSDLYLYIPLGLTVDMLPNKDYDISFNAEYDFFLRGYQRDRFSDADQFTIPLYGVNSDKALLVQDHGVGVKFSLKLLRHFSLVDLYFEPYINFWHIDQSKTKSVFLTGSQQPYEANKNNTMETGCKAGVDF